MQLNLRLLVFIIPLMGVLLTSFVIMKDVPTTSSNFLRKHITNHQDYTSIYQDNYCDLSSGLDEVSTSACSHILVGQEVFLCDHGKKKLFTSRIDDYVCDCMDGSDEKTTKACDIYMDTGI